MARVHYVKAAAKNHLALGIKKGEAYYWWKADRFSPKRVSRTPPRRSQTMSSDKKSRVVAAQENLEDSLASSRQLVDAEAVKTAKLAKAEQRAYYKNIIEGFVGDCEQARDEVQEVQDEYQEALDAWEGGNSQLEDLLGEAENWTCSFEEAVSTAEEVAGRFDDEEDEITIDDALALLEDAVGSLETP